VVSLLVLAGAGVFGMGVGPHLSQGGFDAPTEPSTVAATTLLEQFHAGAPNLTVLVTARHGTVDSPDVAAAGWEITRRLEANTNVANVQSYWELGSIAALRTDHGRQAVIAARVTGTQNQFVQRERLVAADLHSLPSSVRPS